MINVDAAADSTSETRWGGGNRGEQGKRVVQPCLKALSCIQSEGEKWLDEEWLSEDSDIRPRKKPKKRPDRVKAWEEFDSEEEEDKKRTSRIRTCTKVLRFVPPDDEAGYEADDEANVETDDESHDTWGDEVEARCRGMWCFPCLRLGRRFQKQVAEGPVQRIRGILGTLRRWFDRRREIRAQRLRDRQAREREEEVRAMRWFYAHQLGVSVMALDV
ncbi:uncharacterized protein LOC142476177 [Ascaphus truei]|uniref:uncharacterized protein LOC142476177 n=1 Tax=Ascaphus truei TaxID=8439 RepID=UPI003F5A437A